MVTQRSLLRSPGPSPVKVGLHVSLFFPHAILDALAKSHKMAKKKFRPTRLGVFSGVKTCIEHVEILKKQRNAVGGLFATPSFLVPAADNPRNTRIIVAYRDVIKSGRS